MITRKGFIASIGAALTGAASKASKNKEWPLTGDVFSEPATEAVRASKWYKFPLKAAVDVDLDKPIWTPFDTLTSRTTAKLILRRRQRNNLSLWGPVVLCTPEDFKKRWAMLKGRKVPRWSESVLRTGWWKYLGDNWINTTPMNIQAYHAQKQDWKQSLERLNKQWNAAHQKRKKV